MNKKIRLLKLMLASICSFMLAIGADKVKAQERSGNVLYYYFGERQMPVRESNDKLYLRVPEAAATSVKQKLQRQYNFNNEAFSETEDLNFLIVETEKNKAQEVAAYIRVNIPEVEMVRPVLIASDGTEEVIDEWFYVKLKKGVDKRDLDIVLTKYNCTIDRQYEHSDRVYILKATSANSYDGLNMANVFYKEGIFEYAEPDFRPLQLLHSPPPPPNDPNYSLQWSHINTGTSAQFSGTVGADMDVDSAWTITQGDTAIRIAVVDEGVQRNHPDLINNIDPLGFGLHSSVATTGDILSAGHSHGTNVAGIIAAEKNNGIGVAGVAPNCKIIPVNVTVNSSGTYGTSSQLATCLDWAWNTGGADIINNSWGGGSASSLVQSALQNATTLGRGGKGTVVLFSSGNRNSSVSSPAIFEEVISVGAMSMCYERKSTTSCDGENWWGSNYGASLDIAAPGVKIATTTTNSGYNNTFNGTSSSCPNASGVVALMLSANDTLTEERVREILLRTAKKVGGYNYSYTQGQPYGTWSSELGHGMIDAFKAVQAAQNDTKYCPVEIAKPSTLQVCNGNSIALQVSNPDAVATYTWMQNGNTIPAGIGTSYNATTSGSYSVAISKVGCNDTSATIKITVSSSNGVLQADAGRDTTLTTTGKAILGGGPAAKGGTAIMHPMRAFVSDITNNQLIRFDPEQPATNYKIVKTNFMPGFVSGTFFSGAATTPYGLYMAMRTGRYLAKIDTATGDVINIGNFGVSVDFGGMTYDPKTGKIFAVSESNNALYEVNRLTGQATLIASAASSAPLLVSLSADTAGILYAVSIKDFLSVGSLVYTINKTTGVNTYIGTTGYNGNYGQDGEVDPLTNELYACPVAAPLNSTSYVGAGLWKINKTNGNGTLVGTIALPNTQPDAMAFAGPEYKYSWSPTTGLSNPNDGNPQFVPPSAGEYTFVLTATDLCGNTATDTVKITVCSSSITTTSLSASSITHTAATLGWTSIADSATIEYGLQGFTQGSGTFISGVVQDSFRVNGLSPNTSYSFYARCHCNNSVGSWAGPFNFTTLNAPLPLTGITLTGAVKENTASLKWVSLQETDAAYYEVKKSNNGKVFTSVYKASPKANNKTDVMYEWKDNEMNEGASYYRIVGVSTNNDKVYSNTIQLQKANTARSEIQIFPNPIKGTNMNVRFLNMENGDYEIRMYSVTGILINTTSITHAGANVLHEISLDSKPAPGLYHLRVLNAAFETAHTQQILVE